MREEEEAGVEVVKDGEKVEIMAILLRTTSILPGMDLTVLLIPLPSMVCSTYLQKISCIFLVANQISIEGMYPMLRKFVIEEWLAVS